MLDTQSDFARRKRLALNSYQNIKPALEDKNLSLGVKLRILNALVSSIFLYNAEIWTLTKTLSDKVDRFQRRLLRYVINVKYPQKISNTDLYEKTRETPWSEIIRTRRMSWFGHLARLPTNTPARRALEEYLNTATKKPRGGQRFTWIKQMTIDLGRANLTINQALDQAQDRALWRGLKRL